MSQPLENIIKQGYLKKGNTGGNRLSGLLKKIEGQKWFVFTIRQSVPYLEYYDSDTDVFSQRPVNSYCLSRCRNVSSVYRSNPPAFSVVCSDRFIELIASSRPQMLEWVHDLETTLTRLGVIKKETQEHVYSPLPAVIRQPRARQQVAAERETRAVSSLGTNPSSSWQDHRPPPPLPQRPVSNRLPVTASSPTVPNTSIDALSAAQSTDHLHCSNDSDFVSWDVVMRVRESFLQKNGEGPKSCEDMEEAECAGAMACTPPESMEKAPDFSSSLFAESLYSKVKPKPKLVPSDDTLDLTILSNNPSPFPSRRSDSEFSSTEQVLRNSQIEEDELNLLPDLTQVTMPCQTRDLINLSNNPSPLPTPSLRSDSDFSPMDQVVRKSQVEENEYSLLPSVMQDNKPGQTDVNADPPTRARPIPLPRRALPMKQGSQEKQDSTSYMDCTGNGLQSADTSLCPFGEDTKMKQNPFFCLSSDYQANNLDQENKISNGMDVELNDSKLMHDKDENANFYDDKNAASHCVLAPPSIPPRCDSLMGWTATIPLSSQSNQDCTNNLNVYSHPMSSSTIQAFSTPSSPSASQVMFLPPPLDSSPISQPAQQPPPIPPLPLPRRKPSKPTIDQGASFIPDSRSTLADLQAPPRLPRRALPKSISLPDGNPPQLPSRNSKSVAVMKPKLMSSFSFAESDEKAKLLDDQASIASGSSIRERQIKSATLSATPDCRQSGLARKMLLDRANSLHTVVSLKQTQAEILQAEIDKSHVSVTLTQKSGHGLALVDWNGMPCVAGWNQKDFPSLHGKLHIGDMLISVNNVRVPSSDTAQKLLRHAVEPKIEVVLQRMPHAKVFAIRRSAEGQSLGFKREGGTAEILYVDPNGLAADHGLPQYAPGTMGKARCTWFLTEINSRPLSLFFKENEIEHLLYAVGREISIVVQPSDFIHELRRGLKKLKNYKNFVTH